MQQKDELILILDFCGQYNQLIARRVRECNVYCEIVRHDTTADEIKRRGAKGVIFTGGPASVYGDGAPKCDPAIFELGIPVLGICYGMQIMTHTLGGEVLRADKREYGETDVELEKSALFEGFGDRNICLMSHTDYVGTLPEGFRTIARTPSCPNAAIENSEKHFYGIQFHAEVNNTVNGTKIIDNFVKNICGCSGSWRMSSFAKETVKALREKIGSGKALCALSGGVDSSVAAALLNEAIGENLTCIFVDHGLLRKNEGDEVEEVFGKRFKSKFIRVDAEKRFLDKLAVVESGKGIGATIKSHHNVGGLPDYVDFKEIVEPLRDLFKDEVRAVGRELGIPDKLVDRQPFPGPGLAIRVIGDITKEKLDILRDADYIFREEMERDGIDKQANQYFAALTNVKSVGVMGDYRTYDYMIALRSVTTVDFMTATFTRVPYDTLERASSRIVNEVKHVNRVVYDITSKPPGTVEWE